MWLSTYPGREAEFPAAMDGSCAWYTYLSGGPRSCVLSAFDVIRRVFCAHQDKKKYEIREEEMKSWWYVFARFAGEMRSGQAGPPPSS